MRNFSFIFLLITIFIYVNKIHAHQEIDESDLLDSISEGEILKELMQLNRNNTVENETIANIFSHLQSNIEERNNQRTKMHLNILSYCKSEDKLGFTFLQEMKGYISGLELKLEEKIKLIDSSKLEINKKETMLKSELLDFEKLIKDEKSEEEKYVNQEKDIKEKLKTLNECLEIIKDNFQFSKNSSKNLETSFIQLKSNLNSVIDHLNKKNDVLNSSLLMNFLKLESKGISSKSNKLFLDKILKVLADLRLNFKADYKRLKENRLQNLDSTKKLIANKQGITANLKENINSLKNKITSSQDDEKKIRDILGEMKILYSKNEKELKNLKTCEKLVKFFKKDEKDTEKTRALLSDLILN
jgi:hypothetical protein